jgi:hypothetical protein
VDVDRSRVAVGAVAPDRAKQLLAVEGVTGAGHQAGDQLVLAERELDRLAVDGHPPLVLVDRDRADPQAALDDTAVGSAQHGADPAAQLGEPEGLCHVVVCAGLEALDGVGLAVERGEHDDRHHVAPAAQQAGHVVPGGARAERHVEQHDVVGPAGGRVKRRLPVGHGGHAMPLSLERAGEHLAQRPVVVHQQDVERRRGLHRGRE